MTHKFEEGGANGILGYYPYTPLYVQYNTCGNCQYCNTPINHKYHYRDKYGYRFFVGSRCKDDHDDTKAKNWAGISRDNYYRTTIGVYLVSKGATDRQLIDTVFKPSMGDIMKEFSNLPLSNPPDNMFFATWCFLDYSHSLASRKGRSLGLLKLLHPDLTSLDCLSALREYAAKGVLGLLG